MKQLDFLDLQALAGLSGVKKKTLYNAHSTGRGPFAEILTKLGGRVGVWRADYEQFVHAQRRLKGGDQKAA